MSRETERTNGWTVATLKEHMDKRFQDQDKAVTSALMAAKEAVTKAEVAADKRFESVNEFRQTLTDQTNTFIPRQEHEVKFQALEEKYQVLLERTNKRDNVETGQSLTVGKIYAGLAAVGVVITIVVLLANNVIGGK